MLTDTYLADIADKKKAADPYIRIKSLLPVFVFGEANRMFQKFL